MRVPSLRHDFSIPGGSFGVGIGFGIGIGKEFDKGVLRLKDGLGSIPIPIPIRIPKASTNRAALRARLEDAVEEM